MDEICHYHTANLLCVACVTNNRIKKEPPRKVEPSRTTGHRPGGGAALATITFQNFFKIYKKRSGMTGTAMTEEDEFLEIYQMEVREIPTNRITARIDMPDQVYKSEREKFNAIVEQIKELWKQGRPILVGTRSIEKSEKIAAMLRGVGIPHRVLNAKYHEMEARNLLR